MEQASEINILARALKPLVAQFIRALTQFGLVADRREFEKDWLNHDDAYARLATLSMLELFEVVENLDTALRIEEAALEARQSVLMDGPAQQKAAIRLCAINLLQSQLKRWKRKSVWPFIRIA